MTDNRRSDQHKPCTWHGEDGWFSNAHRTDCNAPDCPGCRPCGHDHCAMRGRCGNHVDHAAGLITCPACIGHARTDLHAIQDLAEVCAIEAQHAHIDSEVVNLAGPAADPEQLAARREYREAAAWRRGWCDWPRDPLTVNDPHHPYLVLGDWHFRLREHYGPPTDLLHTIPRAVAYLEGLLAGTFPHDDDFEGFAKTLRDCREHLETVLHDSRRPETGRPCPTCTETRRPRLQKRYADHDTTGSSDTWHCPANPGHWWSERDYRDRVASDYVEHASALTADQLAERLGVKPSTVRRWASGWTDGSGVWHEPVVRRRGYDGQRRQLYDVADALRMCDGSAA